MPLVPVRTAAELTGKDRSTILRAIENGKLSATKSDLGRYLIDPAELERVYGSLRVLPARSDGMPQDADASHNDAAERELTAVREMLERERMLYERDRRSWEEERAFMRGMLEKHTEQIKLLTDQRERAEQERQATAARPRPLLARMFGRR